MSFINDFPHTNIYDKDLGWLIRQYKELNDNYEVLKDIYNIVKNQIHDVTIGQLQEWLSSGTIAEIINGEIFKDLNQKLEQAQTQLDTLEKINKDTTLSIEWFTKEPTDTSDSERIQRAIDTLHSKYKGGTLYFSNKEYEIDKTLKLYDNIQLIGQSVSTTLFVVLGNYPFSQCYDKNSRHDNIQLSTMSITRRGVDINTPLLDWESISWSNITDVSIYQDDNNGINAGCDGLLFGNLSYYNCIRNLQVRKFNIGIHLANESNGNVFFGGGCISCVKYGVYINRTNSLRFFGHSVELVAECAYFLENRSLTNLFAGCRVESTTKSFHAQFESGGHSSVQNLLVCCLDYSNDGEEWGATNFNVNAANMLKMQNWSDKPCFMANHKYNQGTFNNNEFKPLMTSNIVQNRSNSVSISNNYAVFKAPSEDSYRFSIGVECVTAQSSGVNIAIYKNGSIALNHVVKNGVNDKVYNSDFTIYLKANDTVTAFIKTSTETNITNTTNTYFNGSIL